MIDYEVLEMVVRNQLSVDAHTALCLMYAYACAVKSTCFNDVKSYFWKDFRYILSYSSVLYQIYSIYKL